MDNLQALYQEKSETTNVASIEGEADGIADRVNGETSRAQLFLEKGAAKTSDENSNAKNKSGKLESTNWLQIRDQWKHLRDIPFPKLGKKSKIDVLIGSDYCNLLFPMNEVRGGNGEPSARLCPLGWTAIGTIDVHEQHGARNTGFLHTYQMQRLDSSDGELNNLMKRFWILEAIGITPQVDRQLTPDDRLAINKVNETLRFNGERYEVAMPWKHDRPHLPSNQQMAERCLRSVEKEIEAG